MMLVLAVLTGRFNAVTCKTMSLSWLRFFDDWAQIFVNYHHSPVRKTSKMQSVFDSWTVMYSQIMPLSDFHKLNVLPGDSYLTLWNIHLGTIRCQLRMISKEVHSEIVGMSVCPPRPLPQHGQQVQGLEGSGSLRTMQCKVVTILETVGEARRARSWKGNRLWKYGLFKFLVIPWTQDYLDSLMFES